MANRKLPPKAETFQVRVTGDLVWIRGGVRFAPFRGQPAPDPNALTFHWHDQWVGYIEEDRQWVFERHSDRGVVTQYPLFKTDDPHGTIKQALEAASTWIAKHDFGMSL